jgi:prepilin-type N-terminal cleavage/methylation domain-containing protein
VSPRRACPCPSRRLAGAAGFSLLELLVVLWIAAITAAVAVPYILGALDDLRTRAAARYLSGRMFHARSEAVKRSYRVGYQFRPQAGDWWFAGFTDRNGNGIRSAEISSGIDPELWPAEALSTRFAHVSFGLAPGTPLIDGGTGSDPIRVGNSDIVTFDPNGSSSSGTLYLRGRRGAQYAVRVFGVTGRTRMFKYEPGTLSWKPQ